MKAKDSTDGPSALGLPMREFSEAWFAACMRPLSAWQEWNRVVGGQWEQWLQLLARTPTPWLPALAENRSDQPPAIEFFLPWLQVEAANEPALALYGSLGFTEVYRYHYRQPPGEEGN